MTKLDLVLERLRKLPPDQQEAIAVEIELRLDNVGEGSMFSDDEWAVIEASMADDGETVPHEQVVAEIRAKYPG
jgi:hypothetical protein